MPDTYMLTTAQKVADLRAELARRGLDAFILPRFDAHQGEYVAPHDERLKYVTGFSGSAGMAIVTAETVSVFVDGRYTVQVANECAGALFTRCHLHDAPPDQWLAQNAQAGWRVGFDPMHLPPAWYDRFQQSCRDADACLAPQETNPVDAVWPDQPDPPAGRICARPRPTAAVNL